MNKHIVKTIALKEFKQYFTTPLGYIFLIVFLFTIGQVTFEPGRGSFFLMRQADLSSFFSYLPWPFLFFIPAISMRLWAEERKTGTCELLLTCPVSVKEAVVGKFLAAWGVCLLAIFGTFPMIFTVSYLGSPDFGVIFTGHIAAILFSGTLLAIGCFFSALTKNQVISFILSLVVSYSLLMAGSPPILKIVGLVLPQYGIEVFESLSIMNHYEAMIKGVVHLSDLLFFGINITGWLYGSILLINENKAS